MILVDGALDGATLRQRLRALRLLVAEIGGDRAGRCDGLLADLELLARGAATGAAEGQVDELAQLIDLLEQGTEPDLDLLRRVEVAAQALTSSLAAR